jgi:hypothetical protein
MLALKATGQKMPTDSLAKRKWIVYGIAAAGNGGSLIALNQLWYANYPRSPLHSFNDNAEWLQMDKVGHAFTTYQYGRAMHDMMRWSGSSEQSAIWWGGGSGWLYMTIARWYIARLGIFVGRYGGQYMRLFSLHRTTIVLERTTHRIEILLLSIGVCNDESCTTRSQFSTTHHQRLQRTTLLAQCKHLSIYGF